MRGMIANSLLSILYPQRCTYCSNLVVEYSDGVACSDCWAKTKYFTGLETLCTKCGAFLHDAEPLFETYCQSCDGHVYDSARAVGVYHYGIAAAVIHLKSTPKLAPRLRREIGISFRHWFSEKPTLIVPVPLSAQRMQERGFNQAAVIGRMVAESCGIRLDEHSLVRKFHTPIHRVAMDAKSRELSVKNAFEIKRRSLIDGQHIVLVDDVFTTGATASQCARALKKSGAARVDVFTLARAVSSKL